MIDRSTVERIYDAARIVDVVGDFVSLKRRGVNYMGCCPFHNERTPSFSVSPTKNIYKCFGCGKAGNSVNFIMEHEHLGYVEALRYLAKKYGIAIEEKPMTAEEQQQNDRRESLMVISTYATRIFHEQMLQSAEGKAIGLSYFRERGFRDDIIRAFELGYSLELRTAFTQQAIKDGYKEDLLIETGLCIASERGTFDRFAGRVMFPIHSLSGKVIAFGGRVLKTDKKTAKYLNSPESEIYHKSRVLYGIYQAKKSIMQHNKCYLVEGYTDVLSLHQAGLENVVASSGTSLTVEQIQLVKRFTPNITVLYDGDPAGIKASLRGIDLILQEDMNVKVLLLPDGDDPDSFARSHSNSELQDYIHTHECDFITFKAQLLLDDAKNDPLRRAQLITDVVQSISLIPQSIKRSVYIKECARMFAMDELMLTKTAEQMRQKKSETGTSASGIRLPATETTPAASVVDTQKTDAIPAAGISPEQKKINAAERELIRLMLRYGNEILLEVDESTGEIDLTVAAYIIRELCMDELTMQLPLMQHIFDEYRQLAATGVLIDGMHFLQHPNPEVSSLAAGFEPKYELSKIHNKGGAIVKTEENCLLEVVPVSVLVYKNLRVIQRLRELSAAMQEADANGDTTHFETLFVQYNTLTQLKQEFGLLLGKRILF